MRKHAIVVMDLETGNDSRGSNLTSYIEKAMIDFSHERNMKVETSGQIVVFEQQPGDSLAELFDIAKDQMCPEVQPLRVQPSALIRRLQTAKTELERTGHTGSTLYRMISSEVYALEAAEELPDNWRDVI